MMRKKPVFLWYTSHFSELSITHPQKYVNQFPYKFVVNVKNLLVIICRRL